jgi:hypothetical protein
VRWTEPLTRRRDRIPDVRIWCDEHRVESEKVPDMGDPIVNLQREVQRKLGRCMLRLQQYERMMKTLVAGMGIQGPPEQLELIRDKQVLCASKLTLGNLIGMFTSSCLSPAAAIGTAGAVRPIDEGRDGVLPIQTWFRIRNQVVMSPERYDQSKAALAELVALRNELVHHFLDRYDLWQEQGCIEANIYLDASFELIDGHALDLQRLAESMDSARVLMASFMQTPEFEDAFVHGIQPDGTVHWPISTIVECLRDAEVALAINGWTLLNAATEHIRLTHPDQTPQRYRRGSWRQVLHSSEQFDIRKEINTNNAGVVVWYRSRLRRP